jgi:hypothetical protein
MVRDTIAKGMDAFGRKVLSVILSTIITLVVLKAYDIVPQAEPVEYISLTLGVWVFTWMFIELCFAAHDKSRAIRAAT